MSMYIMDTTNQLDAISDGGDQLQNLLERDRVQQKSEQWSKLDKTSRIQLLHAFAEKYGNEQKLPFREVKTLKQFFIHSLNQNKLQKNKDVQYAKESRIVQGIPGLCFSQEKKTFLLKNVDSSRVSTLKSLTPKKQAFLQ